MSDLKFSIIVPLFNAQEDVARCAEMISSLHREDVELILINDGSADQTWDSCVQAESDYSFIRSFSQENKGVSSARNLGLNQSRGEFVLFLDADDSIDIRNMNRVMDRMLTNACLDMVAFGLSFDYYRESRCYRRDELSPCFDGTKDRMTWLSFCDRLYKGNVLSPVWNKIFRRAILIDHSIEFKEDMFLYEDLEFSLHVMQYCEYILFCPEIVYHYRQSEDEGNTGRRLKKIDTISELVEKIELPLKILLFGLPADRAAEEWNDILLHLFEVLVREKISVSGYRTVRGICEDFDCWIQNRAISCSEDAYAASLCGKKVWKLLLQSRYSAMRHQIAVLVKSSRWYQRRIQNIEN